jgi:hypothetical protein
VEKNVENPRISPFQLQKHLKNGLLRGGETLPAALDLAFWDGG